MILRRLTITISYSLKKYDANAPPFYKLLLATLDYHLEWLCQSGFLHNLRKHLISHSTTAHLDLNETEIDICSGRIEEPGIQIYNELPG